MSDETMMNRRLVAARLAVRIVHHGEAYLSSYLSSGSVRLSKQALAILGALWDRNDPRSTAARLEAHPGVPRDLVLRGIVLQHLVEAGLLIDADFDEVAAHLERVSSELAPVPQVDEVELTNACPFTCGFCPRGLGRMTRKVGHLDLGLLQEILDQTKDLPVHKPFGLHHFGDPLLHPKVVDAVRIVRQAGREPELSFNPVLLNRELACGIVEAGAGTIIVSMDGLDTPTLHAMRGPHAGTIEEVERKVEHLIEVAAQRPSPPSVLVSMVATVHNRHQWQALFARYQRRGMPWLKPVVRLLNDFGEPEIAPLAVRRLRQLCGAPYRVVSVLWDGTVVPCCQDFDGRLALGNLRQNSLREIWHGEAAERFRARFVARDFRSGEPCLRCRWRADHYVEAETFADGDAWTPSLWPDPESPKEAAACS